MFIDKAREALAGEPRVSFVLGDAGATGQGDSSFDLVIAHTVYSHLVDPEGALAEAHRVLRPGGQLVIFDGDFATLTVALCDGDPMQSSVGAVLRHMVHAPYLMRRLPGPAHAEGRSVRHRQGFHRQRRSVRERGGTKLQSRIVIRLGSSARSLQVHPI